MSNKEYDIETVKKKMEELDEEVNTFIEVVKDVKEIKDSAEVLQDKLMRHEGEIENKKKELDQLISTTQSLRMNIEEQTKGVIYDLEMKTDALFRDVKSGISQIGNTYENESTQLQVQHDETIENLSNKYDKMITAYEILKIMVDSHELRMSGLNNDHAGASNNYEKIESAINELKKTVYEIQKRPYEMENKLIKMEERIELSINEKYSRQKNFSLVILIILIAIIFFSVVTFYFS